MAREDPQMKLRLPIELKALVEEAAMEAGRSINAEIVHRLANSFAEEVASQKPATMAELLTATEKLKQALDELLKRDQEPSAKTKRRSE